MSEKVKEVKRLLELRFNSKVTVVGQTVKIHMKAVNGKELEYIISELKKHGVPDSALDIKRSGTGITIFVKLETLSSDEYVQVGRERFKVRENEGEPKVGKCAEIVEESKKTFTAMASIKLNIGDVFDYKKFYSEVDRYINTSKQ